MRPSERIAATVVLIMVAPAFLAFPAFGIWCVFRVWPTLDLFERVVFCLSAATLCASLAYCFWSRLDLFFYGRTKKFTLLDEALVATPLVTGLWAVTHTWFGLLLPFVWKVISIQLAAINESGNRYRDNDSEDAVGEVKWPSLLKRAAKPRKRTTTVYTSNARRRRLYDR